MFNKKQFASVLFGVSLLGAVSSNLANAAISQYPLFLGEAPNPNIMFTLDNSGSMNWEFLPDAIGCVDSALFINYRTYAYVGGSECPGNWRDVRDFEIRRYRAAGVNKIFYDPNIRYLPWQRSDGTFFPDSVPNAAVLDPRAPDNSGNKINLIEPNDPNVKHCPKLSTRNEKDGDGRWIEIKPTCRDSELVTLEKFISFYYVYTPGTNPNEYDASKYVKHYLDVNWRGTTKGLDRTDCAASICTYQEEQKNFANWFTYYRKRIFTAIAGVSQAFNPLDGKQRVGFGKINIADRNRNSVDGVRNFTVLKGVRQFIGSDRDTFYNQLFENVTPASGTPLREAMDQVGQYFSRTDAKGPWAENPGVSKGVESACRKSFHILMTDGYWNGNAASTSGADKAETVNGPEITNPNGPSYTYNATAAGSYYNSGATNTLSNIAMYYWNRDLRPDLDNYVQPSANNPAFWQHLVQYTVGLGVDGTLVTSTATNPGDEPDLKAGRKVWPAPGDGDNAQAVDDLWHAAVNSRGLYFSAKNPKAFRDSLTGALNDIANQDGAASTIALNFDRTGGANTLAFAAAFETRGWLGHLVARSVNGTGDVDLTPAGVRWDAATLLPAPASRNIITYNPTTKSGVPFLFANLTPDQKSAVVNSDVVDYLRGSGAKERSNNGTFRNRTTKLGDIVNSSPLYVHKLNYGYGAMSGYNAYLTAKANRNPMLYVGANDGMLHGFDAATGIETFAYVPNSVYPYLKSLSDFAYEHHYFVDGELNEGDAYKSSTSQWRTLLAGSTGAGARSVFMLDVTAPGTVASPGLSGSNLLWELSGESGFDADMGHMLGKIEIVRLRNGSWAAIFGNGYGSTNKKAVLYIVDAFTGNPISGVPSKITFNTGSNTAENGLSQPALLFDNSRKLMAVYAGDLQGNVWKVDFAENGSGTVAYSGAPLFTTKDNASTPAPQPIIQRPALGAHPKGGYLVMFGTGKYYDAADRTSTQTQTVYGIWDKPAAAAISNVTGRNIALQQQTLTAQTGGASLTSIAIDWTNKRGWFVDMTLSSGSRAVGNPYITDDTTLYVTALTPVPNSCKGGGDSELYSFDYVSGGASIGFDASNSSTRLSVVKLAGATGSESRVVVNPPKAQPDCPPGQTCNCPPGQTCKPPPCETKKIIVNHTDGSISERSINSKCQPPSRTWHLLNN